MNNAIRPAQPKQTNEWYSAKCGLTLAVYKMKYTADGDSEVKLN